MSKQMFEVIEEGSVVHTCLADDVPNVVDPSFPVEIYRLADYDARSIEHWSHVYVHSGQVDVDSPTGEHVCALYAGMYALVQPDSLVDGMSKDTDVLIVSRMDYGGMFMMGGPAEDRGRMRYIDGCTDTLLIPPVMRGDPCLNLLHFPRGIDQTLHTHPSVRVGVVASGKGLCRVVQTPGDDLSLEQIDLVPGTMFVIRPGGVHAFSTPYDQEMRVIAWHPDTDTGPTHEDHPMLNRTIIDGLPASNADRAQFRTKE